jgi:hypothetical protein
MNKIKLLLTLIVAYVVYGSILWYNDPMMDNQYSKQSAIEKIVIAFGYSIVFNVFAPIFFIVAEIYRYIRSYV